MYSVLRTKTQKPEDTLIWVCKFVANVTQQGPNFKIPITHMHISTIFSFFLVLWWYCLFSFSVLHLNVHGLDLEIFINLWAHNSLCLTKGTKQRIQSRDANNFAVRILRELSWNLSIVINFEQPTYLFGQADLAIHTPNFIPIFFEVATPYRCTWDFECQ
jgi:hypothetical protein